MPPDYSKGQIYKLWTLESNEIYIGSTINPLYKRLGQHKNGSNKCNSRFLFERYKDVKIELVENFSCNSKKELNAREGHHQRLNKDILVNKCIAGRNTKEAKKQYRHDHAEEIKEHKRQYRIENADKIKEYNKQYTTENADKIKESKKQYAIDNADKLREYQKNYHANKKLQKNDT